MNQEYDETDTMEVLSEQIDVLMDDSKDIVQSKEVKDTKSLLEDD